MVERAHREGWGQARSWGWATAAVAAWWLAAAQVMWWARWLWRRDIDVVGQGRAVLDGGEVDVAAWAAALLSAAALVACAAYLVPMVRLAGRWWPTRPWRGMHDDSDVGGAVVVRAPRTVEPWRRAPREMVWVPAQPPSPAAQDAATPPGDEAPAVVSSGEVASVRDAPEPEPTAPCEAAEEPAAVQAALELAEDDDGGSEGFLLRVLTPMPRLMPAIRETIVFAALNGGVVRLEEMMRELDLKRDAARRRCKRAADAGWMHANEDGTFKLGLEVVTDLEMLRRCAARGDEATAREIAAEIRSRPLPQMPVDWLDENAPHSYREELARQAQDALTECIESFGDADRLFEHATDACWGS